MGWLWVWLQGREERRAEAAVRRQLAAVEGGRGVDSFDVEPVADDGLPPVDVDDPATWPADFDDGPALEPVVGTMVHLGSAAIIQRVLDVFAECDRADALAGKRGGFVTTARIRELLRGEP